MVVLTVVTVLLGVVVSSTQGFTVVVVLTTLRHGFLVLIAELELCIGGVVEVKLETCTVLVLNSGVSLLTIVLSVVLISTLVVWYRDWETDRKSVV